MKRQITTIAIVLGMGMAAFAGPDNGGVFSRGATDEKSYGSSYFNSGSLQRGFGSSNNLVLPDVPNNDQTGDHSDAPLGSGLLLLGCLGGAYLIGKRRKED